MALLNMLNFGGGYGLLGGLETGQNTGSYGLGPTAEAQLAQDARDAAALRMRRAGQRGGTADMSLFNPEGSNGQPDFVGRWQSQLNPAPMPQSAPVFPMGAGPMPQQAPQPQQQPPQPQGGLTGPVFGQTPFGQPLPQPTPQPEQAAIPPNAQPAQGQMQPPQVQEGPGIGDRISAGLHGFLNGRAFGPALSNAIIGAQTGQRTDPAGQAQQNQAATYYAIQRALVSKGVPPEQAHGIAMSAAVNPEVAKAVLPDTLGSPKTMEQAIAQQYGRGGKGAMGALNDWSTFKKTTSAAEATGKVQGENAATLPTTLEKADEALNLIEQIRNHPGRQYGTGALGVLPGIPGTAQKDFVTLVDQAKGQAFLQAFQSLKGGGQITEVEGKKATDAIARLDRAQTKQGFDRALDDLKDVITAGRNRAGMIAGGAATPATGQAKSTSGWTELPGGYRYKQVGQ